MTEKKSKQKPLVVLVHGWMGDTFHMSKLDETLNKLGFETLNISYPSTAKKLDELRDFVVQEIKKNHQKDQPIYFIGFSMGGVISRMVIEDYPEFKQDLRRAVFVGSPMAGCELSKYGDMLPDFMKVIPGDAILEVKSKAESWKDKVIDYDAAVIAGSGGDMFPGADLLLKKKGEKENPVNDSVVRLDETKVKGVSDEITLPIDHHFMPHGICVIEQILQYFKHGKFDHTKSYKKEFSPLAFIRSKKKSYNKLLKTLKLKP
ncbi:MAG: hypothetical protein CMP22_06265 [Rickettsiales bacterium]|nr:hypothetical protein [Rickettsiales bacterium]